MNQRFAGRFLLLRRLGKGGMGEVFLARDTATGLECALKRLPRETGAGLPSAVRREFEALTRIRHPAVVAVHELGMSPEGIPFCTMEYVPGLPADEAIARDDWSALFYIAARVTHGLEALHAAHVAHGDLKPSNLLVLPGERPGMLPRSVRLVDFGLAALIGGAGEGHVGTAGFAAPEVVKGQAPSPVSDLYGLGATLYAIIARAAPFPGDTRDAVLRNQEAGPPDTAPLDQAGAPAPLKRLILGLMAREPNERPRDAREVRRELETLHPAARRPLSERVDTSSVVGRERELARLESWWAQVPVRPPITVITGAAGTGKSALLSELATRAALAARPVIHLSCGSLSGPGAVAAALMRRLAADAGADPAPVLGAGVQESALDELSERAAQWAHALVVKAQPVVVLLDDAELLDGLSRAWIRRVVARPEHSPLAWVLARRSGVDVPEDEEVLFEAGQARRIELSPLAPDAIERLAAVRLGEVAPQAVIHFLRERCGGHPGLVVDLLRAAARTGAIQEDEAGLRVEEETLRGLVAPESYEAALIQRLENLDSTSRRAIEALAVWGSGLDRERLHALEPETDGDTIGRLLESGLATRTDSGELLLWPPLLADRIVAALPAERRRSLHRAALDTPGLSRLQRFEHLRGAGEARAALEEARAALAEGAVEGLAARAAEPAEREVSDRAAEWHERAGRWAMERGQMAAAMPHFRRALELASNAAERAGWWVDLARAAVRVGALDELRSVVENSAREDLPPGARARIAADDAMGWLTRRERELARSRGTEALALAEAAGEAEAEGTAAQVLAYVALEERDVERAEVFTRRATAAFERAGRPRYTWAMGLNVSLLRAQRKTEEALALLATGIAAARVAGDRAFVGELHFQLGFLQSETGRWEAAIRSYEATAQNALEDSRPINLAISTCGLAILFGLTGHLRIAKRNALEAIRLCRSHRPRVEPSAWRALAQARRFSGHLREAERAARRGARLAESAAREDSTFCSLELANVMSAMGRWSNARAVAAAALVADSATLTVPSALVTVHTGRAALREGDVEIAERHLEAVRGWLREISAPYVGANADLLAAEIAFRRGSVSDGFDIGQRSLDAFGALPAPPERALAALELARLAPLAGDRRMNSWLELATSTFERLGNRRGREQALARWVEVLKHNEGTAQTMTVGGERGLLERVGWLLHSLTDLHELTQRAMSMVVEQLDAERGVLLLQDRETGQLRVMAEQGAVDNATRSEAVRYSRNVVERVTESGGSLLIVDAPSDVRARFDSVRNLGLRSIVCVPLYLGGAVIGVVYMDDSRAHRFGDADRGLLEGFAHLMAVAIEKARGHEEIERMKDRLEGENLTLRREIGSRFQMENLIGGSSEMRRISAMVQAAGRGNSTVLITGENGTGKELVAKVLHHSGSRRNGPFIPVNCGAITETLIESELFGILAGVATNVRARDGRFVQANGGTLFLDEIGDMPLSQQVALLAAIANREVVPVGGHRPIPVDVRIMAATNRNLRKLVEEGRFREDLYFRVAVLEIELPPLRERKADIPALARHFIQQFAAVQEREAPKLSTDFMAVLMQSDWPGNVRELQNYTERVMAMNFGPVLRPDPLPRDLQERPGVPRLARVRGLPATVEEIERRMVTEALQKAGGNQSEAARKLGLTEQSLRYRLRKYGLDPRSNRRVRQN
jgi:transcriptional regulator with GAF, ATPase, and Fis domain